MSEAANQNTWGTLSYLIRDLLREVKDIRSPVRQCGIKKNEMDFERTGSGKDLGVFDIAIQTQFCGT